MHFYPFTEIKSTPIPHTEIAFISTTHTKTKSILMPTLKPCNFRAGCVIHTSACSCDISENVYYNCEYQLVIFLTFPYYCSITPKIFRKYIHTIFSFCYMVYTRLRVIVVAGLRYVPCLLYVVSYIGRTS